MEMRLNTWKMLCLPLTIEIGNVTVGDNQKPGRRYASSQLLELATFVFRATKILSTAEVDIFVDHSFQSYQSTVKFLSNVAFRATGVLSKVEADIPVDYSSQSYPKSCQQWKLTFLRTVAF